MAELVAIAISIVALLWSAATFWLLHLHRGRIEMSPPVLIVFAYEVADAACCYPKIVFRSALHATAHRGLLVEAIYARLHIEGDRDLTLPIWGLDSGAGLNLAGGLFVGREGIDGWHHLAASRPMDARIFHCGNYRLEVFARLKNRLHVVNLWTQSFSINDNDIDAGSGGVQLVRNPESGSYEGATARHYLGRPTDNAPRWRH